MTFGQLLLVIRARWLLGAAVLGLTLALVLAIGWLMPRQYTASTAVMLEVRAPDPVAATTNTGVTVETYIATQADVVRSERVILLAQRALAGGDLTALRAEWQDETGGAGKFEPWLAERLTRALTVRPAKDSSVINISYQADDPRLAATLANAITTAYIDTTLQLRREPARLYNTFFDDRARALRESLEKAQSRLSAYQRDKGLIATDERLDVENARLAELSTRVVEAEAAAADSGGRAGQAATRGDRMPEVLANPLISTLSAEHARVETRLQEVSSRLGNQHPQVIELRDQAKELKSRLDAVTARAVDSVAVTNRANTTRLADLRAQMAEQRTKVMHLKGLRDDAMILQRDVESAQRAYDGMLARLNQSDVESQNQMTNVTLLKEASEPVLPSSPKLKLMAVVGGVLGLLFALAAMVLREHTDRRLRSEADVLQQLGQNLLVLLPESRMVPATRSQTRERRLRLLDGLSRNRLKGSRA